jgi:hypothetical protein
MLLGMVVMDFFSGMQMYSAWVPKYQVLSPKTLSPGCFYLFADGFYLASQLGAEYCFLWFGKAAEQSYHIRHTLTKARVGSVDGGGMYFYQYLVVFWRWLFYFF